MRLGAIPGATPDKWVTRWRERYPDFALSLERFDEAGQLERLRAGTVDVGYIRFPEDAEAPIGDDLHRVWLYREAPVVCASRDHWVAAAETSVTWEEIAEESFVEPAEMLPASLESEQAVPPADDVHVPKVGADLAAGERMALEVVASGAGLVILPNSVARMLARRDIVIREVEGIPGYDVGLAWLREADGPVIQEFIGVARGRKPGSGRSEITTGGQSASGSESEPKSDGKHGAKAGAKAGSKPGAKSSPRQAAARAAPGRSRPGPKPGSRRGQPPRGRRRPR